MANLNEERKGWAQKRVTFGKLLGQQGGGGVAEQQGEDDSPIKYCTVHLSNERKGWAQKRYRGGK